MYYYIVDPSKLAQRTFERVQNQLYSSLSTYRINGEVSRVSALRTVPQLVEIAFSRGVKTLVAVGSDETIHDVINSLKRRDITLGFIPLLPSELGNILGISSIDHACKTIALRRVTHLDAAVVHNNLFITKLSFGLNLNTFREEGFFQSLKQLFSLPTFEVKFSADNQYSAILKVTGGIIINGRDQVCTTKNLADPTDGILDVLLLPKLSRYKIFKFRKHILSGCFESIPQSSLVHLSRIDITSPEGLPLRMGSRVIAKTPATIEVVPHAIKIIASKERLF